MTIAEMVELAFGYCDAKNRQAARDAIQDVPVASWWTGYVALTPDFLPVFGRTGRFGNLLYAAGYAGHGLSLASYAGKILTDLALERDPGPARVLIERFVPPFPPEPLRSAATHALLGAMRWQDRRVDRAARRADTAPDPAPLASA